MLPRFLPILCLGLALTGCATTAEYNPVQSATSQTFLLNEAALRKVHTGMTTQEAHQLLGQEIIVGYSYQNGQPQGPEPITLKNPYKTAPSAKPGCTIEYFVTAIRQPDGVISDNELMPLLFCDGVLTAKGWDQVK